VIVVSFSPHANTLRETKIGPEAVPVKRGFCTAVGRLDVGDGRSLAPLGYGRNRHLLNVFVWPTREAAISARTGSRQGCLRRGPGRGGVAPSASSSHSGNELLRKPVIVSPRMVPYSSTFYRSPQKQKLARSRCPWFNLAQRHFQRNRTFGAAVLRNEATTTWTNDASRNSMLGIAQVRKGSPML
jgi:hypothetical protein